MENDQIPPDLAKQRPIEDFGWMVAETTHNYFRSERKAQEYAQTLTVFHDHIERVHPNTAFRMGRDRRPWRRPGPVEMFRVDRVVDGVEPPAPSAGPAQDIPPPLQAFMDSMAAALGDAIGGGPDGVYRFPVHVTGSGLVVPGRCGRPGCACGTVPQD